MLPLILGAATSAIGSIANGVLASKQRKRESKALDNYETTLEKWYNKEMSTDYLDTEEAKKTLSLLRNRNREDKNILNSSITKQGLTDEAKVAFASDLNRGYASDISRIASYDTGRKENINSKYWNTKSDIEQERQKIGDNKSGAGEAIFGLTEQVGNQMGTLYGAGVFDKKVKKSHVYDPENILGKKKY